MQAGCCDVVMSVYANKAKNKNDELSCQSEKPCCQNVNNKDMTEKFKHTHIYK